MAESRNTTSRPITEKIRDADKLVRPRVKIHVAGFDVKTVTVLRWFDTPDGKSIVLTGIDPNEHEVWCFHDHAAELIGTLKSEALKATSRLRRGAALKLSTKPLRAKQKGIAWNPETTDFEWIDTEWIDKDLTAKCVSVYDLGERTSGVFHVKEKGAQPS